MGKAVSFDARRAHALLRAGTGQPIAAFQDQWREVAERLRAGEIDVLLISPLDFARRLARALGLPFEVALTQTDDRPEQKTMANSTQQARNVDGAFAVDGPLSAGPVLLVDDMVDSGWTLTVAAWLLRSHGSGEVWPLALARTGAGE